MLSGATYGFYVFTFLEGLLIVLASTISLVSVKMKKKKWLRYTLIIYPLIGTMLLILILIEFVFTGQRYADSADRKKGTDPLMSDGDLDSAKSSVRTYLAVNGIIEIAIGLIILLFVRNRTIAYKHWLEGSDSRSNDPFGQRSDNEIDSELKTIVGVSLKD